MTTDIGNGNEASSAGSFSKRVLPLRLKLRLGGQCHASNPAASLGGVGPETIQQNTFPSLPSKKMGFLKHIRSRSRLKSGDDSKSFLHHVTERIQPPSWKTLNPTAEFPAALVEELLSWVCPHTRDDTYQSCEDSMVDGGCMLCDMRDLAQCASVNRQWFGAAENLL